MKNLLIIAAPFALLSGCGSPNDPGTGGVTKAEAQALNEAAESLDIGSEESSNASATKAPVPAEQAE